MSRNPYSDSGDESNESENNAKQSSTLFDNTLSLTEAPSHPADKDHVQMPSHISSLSNRNMIQDLNNNSKLEHCISLQEFHSFKNSFKR